MPPPEPSNTVVTEQIFGQSSNAGSSTTYSRGDHTHGTPTTPIIPQPSTTVISEQTNSQQPNAGSSTTYSRGDHTHGTPPSGAVSPLGRSFINQTSNRAFNTVYTNSDTRGMLVFITIREITDWAAVSNANRVYDLLSDSSNPPTSVIARAGWDTGGFTVPNQDCMLYSEITAYVKPGENYELLASEYGITPGHASYIFQWCELLF